MADYSDQILACREIVSGGLRMEAAALDRRIKRSGANSIQCEGRHGRWRASAFVRIGNKSYLAKSESDGPLDAIVALFTEIHDYYTRNQGADE